MRALNLTRVSSPGDVGACDLRKPLGDALLARLCTLALLIDPSLRNVEKPDKDNPQEDCISP